MIVVRRKRIVALITVGAFILSSVIVPGSPRADDTAIFTASFPPNIMIILDRSGSMQERPDGTGGTDSKGNSILNTVCMDSLGNPVTTAPAINKGCAPLTERKVYIAVQAMQQLLDRNGDGAVNSNDTTAGTVQFRFGYMRFFDPDFIGTSDGTTWFGAGQLATIGNYQAGTTRLAGGSPSSHPNHADVGTDYARLWNGWGGISCNAPGWLGCSDGLSSLQARGGTPLAASLEETRRYFSGYTIFSPEKGPVAPPDGGPNGPDPAISGDTGRSCRLQYAVLITDGADTYACDGNGSESQADQYRRRRASVTGARDLQRAGVKLFVIGFGTLPAEAKNTLNWMAWYGGSDNPDVNNNPQDPSTLKFVKNGQVNAPCNASSASANDPGDPSNTVTGYAFFAETATELTDAVNKAVVIITQEVATFTSPTVATVRTTDSSKVYLASFKPQATDSFWPGNLKGFAIDLNGEPIGTPIWNGVGAGELLGGVPGETTERRTADSRTIYTIDGNKNRLDFTTANDAILKPLLGYASDPDTTNTDKLINYIRGKINRDGTTPAAPGRWKLGDIFHSNPKVVGPPSFTYFEPYDTNHSFGNGTDGFRDKTNIKTRRKVIYTGANDGALHAFDAGNFQSSSGLYDNGTGAELWAFIPPFDGPISPSDPFLDNLKTTLTATHTYFVDGSPKTADVWWGTNNTAKSVSEWRTVLIAGQRKGGHYYTALDITDPAVATHPAHLWSFTDSKLGQTWSEPVIGKVKIQNTDGTVLDRWVAVVGGGYDTTKDPAMALFNPLAPSPTYTAPTDAAPGVGNVIFVIDLATGKKIWEFTYLSTDSERKFLQYAFPSSPSAVDINGDGYLDRVYAGDLGGQMWRLDISAVGANSSNASILSTPTIGMVANWAGARFFSNSSSPTASPTSPLHPIYFPPSVAFTSTGDLFVFFGTGDRENNIKNDAPTVTTADRFYSVKDSFTSSSSVPPVTLASDLQGIPASSLDSFNPSLFPKGWYLTFADNEKAISGSVIFAGILIFPTFLPAPPAAGACLSSGSPQLYLVKLETAQGLRASDGTILSASDPGAGTSGTSKFVNLGAGLGIASTPVISIGDLTSEGTREAQLLLTTSSGGGGFAAGGASAGLNSQNLGDIGALMHIRSWRQF